MIQQRIRKTKTKKEVGRKKRLRSFLFHTDIFYIRLFIGELVLKARGFAVFDSLISWFHMFI